MAIGTAMAIAGAVSATGSIIKGIGEANQAKAQGEAAQQNIQRLAQEKRRVAAAARPTAAEIRQQRFLLSQQEQAVERQERILNEVDPNILEAAKQQRQLLKGEQADVLAPLQRQRRKQRQQLENQLRDQLGPAFATSTAGSSALAEFDAQSQDVLTNAQFGAIGQLGNVAAQQAQLRQAAINPTLAFGQLTSNLVQNLGQRRLQGALGVADLTRAQGDQALAKASTAGAGARAVGGILGGIGGIGASLITQQNQFDLMEKFGTSGGFNTGGGVDVSINTGQGFGFSDIGRNFLSGRDITKIG